MEVHSDPRHELIEIILTIGDQMTHLLPRGKWQISDLSEQVNKVIPHQFGVPGAWNGCLTELS
jgi:hypothetical protein